MKLIIYLIYLSIVFGSWFTLCMAKVRASHWQVIAIMLSIAGAYLCGFFHAFL